MTVTAMLAWWNEPVELLDACVRSLARIADRVVAVDGGYERWPGATRTSPPDQAAAITTAGKAAGVKVEIYEPEGLWPGQVAKRDYMLRAAAQRSSWVFPVDADWILHGPREAIRHELEETRFNVVDVAFYTTPNYTRPLEQTAATEWHEGLVGETIRIPILFRALPGMRVERFHWWYSALLNDKRVGLWGCEGVYPSVPSMPLKAPMLVEHRCLHRPRAKVLQNRRFCTDRVELVAATGQEDAVCA